MDHLPSLTYSFESNNETHSLEMAFVEGTRGRPYVFGEADRTRTVELPDFFISTHPVTQALWTHVMVDNPSLSRGATKPVENVSWLDLTSPAGFLDRINSSELVTGLERRLRLPSETEWEYAARGGPHWTQGFRLSGSNEIDEVAWYQNNSWDVTHDVGRKTANQLGIYDMSGNVWEWCQDSFIRDVSIIPTDGSPFVGDSSDRILRGGCFHNWAVHCTVSKRYEIVKDYHDGCIGFRLALGVS